MSRRANIEVRERILAAAHKLFYDNGFKGVSMSDIAAAAGVKKANLFHYYPAKEALALAALEQVADGMKRQVAERFAGRGEVDPLVSIASMFDEAAGRMRESGCSGGCFIGNVAQELSDHNEKVRLKVQECLQFWCGEVASFLERARTAGFFRPDLRPSQAAEAIVCLLEGALLCSKASKQTRAVESAKQMAVGYLEAFQVHGRSDR
jgi:AcrR family transcriptional regulator